MAAAGKGRKKLRVIYRTARIAFPENGKKAKAYFGALEEDYTEFWRPARKEGLWQSEVSFYNKRYQPYIDRTNERHLKSRHRDRLIDARILHGRANTCPEEVFVQIGGKEGKIGKKTFLSCMRGLLSWMEEWSAAHGGHMHVLSAHVSKAAPYHAVIRRVWDYEEPDGTRMVSMRMALKESGVPLLDPSIEESRFNNRKARFDMESRAMLILICERHGLDIERGSGVSTLEKAMEIRKQAEEEENAAREVLKQLTKIEGRLSEAGLSEGVMTDGDGSILVPRDYYYLLRIRDELRDAYLRNDGLASGRLLSAIERKREGMRELELLIQRRRILEYEYMSLRLGLARCGYILGEEEVQADESIP